MRYIVLVSRQGRTLRHLTGTEIDGREPRVGQAREDCGGDARMETTECTAAAATHTATTTVRSVVFPPSVGACAVRQVAARVERALGMGEEGAAQ